ncbi:MAG: ABC transporter ATP-binding protein [Firmicutes bacterium]|nr:ABC transporter ATP-binding protein [Bacillota bacterium]
MAEIELVGLTKEYTRGIAVVKSIDLKIEDGETVVLVGPSGCGKTTTLRMIAGLEKPTSGKILMDGMEINDIPVRDRDMAMIFQNYALYENMSVFDNMAFPLKMKKVPKEELRERVEAVAAQLGLTEYLDRRPKALSGGERQRVAMGRAIIRKPKVYLMDEPLSNLDAKLRMKLRTELAEIKETLATTMIYVTHDQTEAMTLADKIVVMKDGEIMQVGTPQEIYDRPANPFVAEFFGSLPINFIRKNGVLYGIRPENIEVRNISDGKCSDWLKANLIRQEMLGAQKVLYLKLGKEEITVSVDSDFKVEGSILFIRFNKERIMTFQYAD